MDPLQVSSDGFVFTLNIVMLHLCSPFLDASFSKISMGKVSLHEVYSVVIVVRGECFERTGAAGSMLQLLLRS